MSEKWFKIQNKSKDTGEIHIYGYITDEKWMEEDVTPKWFKDETDKLNGVKNIDLFVNSGGGGVFAGLAIYNMIKRLSANVTAYIDGIAASTASWLIQAADKIIMPENALMMIHNPSSVVFGTEDDMRKEADVLSKVKSVIVSSYNRTKKITEDKIHELMNAETWMTGKEAFDYGFVDVVSAAKKITSSIKDSSAIVNGIEIDLTKYKSFPKGSFQEKTNSFERIINARTKLLNLKKEA